MMMQNNYLNFINICKRTEKELKEYLRHQLLKYYPTESVIEGEGFLYARQDNCPVLLTAHMDTVHKETVKFYEEMVTKGGSHIISSPQGIGGDDRCGVFMILQILRETKFRPGILFCEQEEIGGVGSGIFCTTEYINELKDLKFFIELDRANANDLVFYDDENYDFHDWCEGITGYKEAYGSFSDISNLCPETKVAGVNISCGYYKAHTTNEYVIWEEMLNSIQKVKGLLTNADSVEQFAYVEAKRKYKYYSNYYDKLYNWDRWDDWSNYPTIGKEKDTVVILDIEFYENEKETMTCIEGKTEDECWRTFFVNHPSVCFNDILDWELY